MQEAPHIQMQFKKAVEEYKEGHLQGTPMRIIDKMLRSFKANQKNEAY